MNWILSLAFCLSVAVSHVEAFGLQLGPFELALRGGMNVNRTMVFDNPICYAISHQKRLEMIIEGEQHSEREIKKVVKRVIIEPYIFGRGRNGQPILRGNIVSEKMIKEVTIKFGEDEEYSRENEDYFSATVRSEEAEEPGVVDIRKVSHLHVIENSHFDAPKNLDKLFTGEPIHIVCHIVPEENPKTNN